MALYEALVSPEGGGGAGGFRRSFPTKAPRSRASALQNRVWTEEVPVRTEASGFRIQDRAGLDYDIYTTGWTPTMRSRANPNPKRTAVHKGIMRTAQT